MAEEKSLPYVYKTLRTDGTLRLNLDQLVYTFRRQNFESCHKDIEDLAKELSSFYKSNIDSVKGSKFLRFRNYASSEVYMIMGVHGQLEIELREPLDKEEFDSLIREIQRFS